MKPRKKPGRKHVCPEPTWNGWDVFMCGLVMSVLVSLLVYIITDSHWREEAVTKGKAEFYLDSNYNKRWKWLPNSPYINWFPQWSGTNIFRFETNSYN